MENTELCKKLRELSRSGSPFRRMICKTAEQRIAQQERQLAKMREILIHLYVLLPKLDTECRLCDHREDFRQCIEIEGAVQCVECFPGCFCRDCGPNGSKWINSKIREVLELVENMQPVTNQTKGET